MILSDVDIQRALADGRVVIDPAPQDDQYSPSALDLRLDCSSLTRWTEIPVGLDLIIDPGAGGFTEIFQRYSESVRLDDQGNYVLRPGQFVLGTTIETVELPRTSRIAARVEGRSTLARCGMSIHLTAPTIHAGFDGVITLEIRNEGPMPIKLRHEMRVCQLIFEVIQSEPGRELDSAFVGQRDASGARRRRRAKPKPRRSGR